MDTPKYYMDNGIEVIDKQDIVTADLEGIQASCVSNIVKYYLRCEGKGHDEDIRKANNFAHQLVYGHWREDELQINEYDEAAFFVCDGLGDYKAVMYKALVGIKKYNDCFHLLIIASDLRRLCEKLPRRHNAIIAAHENNTGDLLIPIDVDYRVIQELKEKFMDCVNSTMGCEKRGDRTHLHGEAMGLCSAAGTLLRRDPVEIYHIWLVGHHVA